MTPTDLAGWIAPVATMIAAMMTAANLGARVTGWGFVVFTFGSVAWSIVGIGSGQTNLLLANGFLTVVNLVGIWRWLGRQARYDTGGAVAERDSSHSHTQTKFAMGHLTGAKVVGADGEPLGRIVDAMLGCEDHRIAYLVIGCGGIGGVGETLHAVEPGRLSFGAGPIKFDGDGGKLCSLPRLAPDDWPGRTPQSDAPFAP